MKKYEFVKLGIDDWKLKYKDKEFNFKTDVALAKDTQGIQKKAKMNMILDLTKQGISAKDLEVETKKDGKTIIDNTNKNELLQIYIEEASTEFFNNVIKDKFGLDVDELIEDIGLETDKEGEEFANELALALSGKIPSKR